MTKALVLLCCIGMSALAADFTTYIGDGYEHRVAAMATDASGNTYLTGSRTIPGSADPFSSETDIFVTKLDTQGAIVFTSTFSGKGNDTGNGIAVDTAGNIIVVGATSSTNFPLRGALQTIPGRSTSGVLMKLSPAGSLVFSTYFGGTQGDSRLYSAATDQAGDIYLTGTTDARDYPRTAGMPAGTVTPGGPPWITGALIAKISSAGDKVLYSGVLSGTQHTCTGGSSCFLSPVFTGGVAIAVDAGGNAYFAGNTTAPGLPTTAGALQQAGIGAFVGKVNAGGTGLGYLTYLSSTIYGLSFKTASTSVAALRVDAAGNAYVAGTTSDWKFPATAGSAQPAYSIPVAQIDPYSTTLPNSDAFVAKLRPDGTAMVWATYLGAAANIESATALVVDGTGSVYIAGESTPRPAANSTPPREFFAKIDNTGASAQIHAQPSNTTSAGVAISSQGRMQQAGRTGIVSNVTNPFSGTRLFGPANAATSVLTGRIAPAEIVSLYGEALAPSQAVANPQSGFFPTLLGETQVTVGGVFAPLLYVSPTQINAVIPNNSVPGATATVRVLVRGELRAEFRAVIVPAVPEIFRSTTGAAAALNQDGTINSQDNPAPRGSFVSIWATGVGRFAPGTDGQVATDAQPYCACRIINTTAVPDTELSSNYAGSAPGFINGAVQVNFRLPPDSGTLSIALRAGTSRSEAVTVFVRP